MLFSKKRVNVLENGVSRDKNKLKPIDSPVYGYWAALYRSFYSKYLYVDVGKRWKGLGLRYFLLVIALCSIPYSLRIMHDFNDTFNMNVIEPVRILPSVMIQKGEVSFDKPMPYLIKNKKDQVVTIIDTTGQVTDFNNTYPNLTILITKDTFYFRVPAPEIPGIDIDKAQNKGTIMAQPFDKTANLIFNGKKILEDNSSIYMMKYSALAMVYPVVISMAYCIFALIFIVFAFTGQLFARIFFSFELSFVASCRLFMVAMTPMMSFLMILLSLGIVFPGSGFVLLALMLGYYSFAIRSLKSDSRLMVRQ